MIDIGARVQLTGERSRPWTEDDGPLEGLVYKNGDAWIVGDHSSSSCITGTVAEEAHLPVWPATEPRPRVLLDTGEWITTDLALLEELPPDPAASALAVNRARLATDIMGGATAPAFASTPRIGFGSVSTANTNRDGTGTIVDLATGVSAGTRIERLVIQTTGDPADSDMTIYLFDGSTSRLFDEVDLGNPAAASATVSGFRFEKKYSDLVLPSSSWKIQAAITVALTAGTMATFALGADLT